MDLQGMLNRLLLLEHNHMSMERFFVDNQVQKIAIYGMGLLGCRVYEHLKMSNIEILCAFDREAESFREDNELQVLLPEKMLEQEEKPELILVASSNYYYEIKEEWEERAGIDMISVEEVIEYCVVGEELEIVKRK